MEMSNQLRPTTGQSVSNVKAFVEREFPQAFLQ